MGKMSPVVPVRDSVVSVGDQIPAVSNHPGQFPKVCVSLEEQSPATAAVLRGTGNVCYSTYSMKKMYERESLITIESVTKGSRGQKGLWDASGTAKAGEKPQPPKSPSPGSCPHFGDTRKPPFGYLTHSVSKTESGVLEKWEYRHEFRAVPALVVRARHPPF